ncbi:MAG TPA: hypothetical protein VLJ68_03980 [Chitinophagaceae bacterium]|nr:hypothetical protein [Chitinophagaceae bacterium]
MAFVFSSLLSIPAMAQDDEDEPDSTLMYQSVDTLKEEEDEVEVKHFWHRDEYSEDDDTVQLRQVPADRIKKMKGDKDFWYADLELNRENQKTKSRGSIFGRAWFQVLLWIVIIGGFAAFLMVYLSGSQVGLFRKKRGSILNDEDIGITENIFEINYQKEIDKAVREGNFRLAIRLMFLRTLKKLSDKNVIEYKQERTNLDYLLQLQSTNYYTEFFRITRNYEYSWYGLFDINEDIYGRIRKDFDHFENQIEGR